MRSYRSSLSSIIVAGLCSGGVLMAQGTQTASMSGQVLDKSGAAVVGATVRLSSPSMQGMRTLTTNDKGQFFGRLLPPGNYSIEVYKSGFQTIKLTQQMGMDQNFQPRIVLSKTQTAVVEVVAAPPAVDKTDVKTATNFNLDAIDKLPTANRTMETVALLTPGVVTGVGGRVQIRGAMTSGNAYLVDGQNIEDNAYANRGVRMIDDAVEEIQVITGAASAEYGNIEGGVINSITRSGSNEFTGQIRAELGKDNLNAHAPMQERGGRSFHWNKEMTYSVGGPILKDRLWFYGAYFDTKKDTSSFIDGDALGANQSYIYTREETRKQAKLTWSITQDHTLVGSWNAAEINDNLRDYSSGELSALVPQKSTSGFWNMALRSTWAPWLTTDIRIGGKKQKLEAGASAAGGSPIYSYNDGYFYHNGIFNSTDGGDNRNNRTANFKASLYWDAMGTHITDVGTDYYRGVRRARNEQTPTGYTFGVTGYDLTTETARPYDIWTYQSTLGESKNYTTALYVNDKWTLNQHLTFQIGLRWDKFSAENEAGTKTASADGLSPRLGIKYDVFGDSKWILALSYARYNGKVLESITNAVTGQGNPTEIDYHWLGTRVPGTSYADITNPSNYDYTWITYYNNPTFNVKLADNLKAPHVDEYQGSVAYTYNSPAFGSGFVRATAVYKKWGDIIDYSVGTNGLSEIDPTVNERFYMKVWRNNPDAIRVYKGLEFDFQWNKGAFSATGNVTISSLRGNYEGEGTSTPGRGEGINAWNVSNLYDSSYTQTASNVQLWDRNQTTPYGYLSGHVPVSVRLTANYTKDFGVGPTSIGLIYKYTAGRRYSDTRSVDTAAMNALTPSEAGSTFTQYKDMERGGGSFNGVQYWDLAINQDVKTVKVAGKPVVFFGKFVIQNVFNHQQQVDWNTNWDPETTSLNNAWVPTGNYGKPTSSSNYALPRTFTFSIGVRY